jgi:hypothetical protein
MKNIHLLPTDKPTRLFIHNAFNDLRIGDKSVILDNNKHLYITSDEPPREGDWVFNISSKTKFKAPKKLIDLINDPNVTLTTNKKIILTTDEEIIADGVQPIDNDFLQWFVKNPNCEEVLIIKGYKQIDQSNPLTKGSTASFPHYEIVIPKEEPKPHSFCETPEEKCTMSYCDENGCQNRKRVLVEPKDVVLGYKTSIDAQMLDNRLEGYKETLEEEAARHFNKEDLVEGVNIQYLLQCAFIAGAKCQEERMWSDEEVITQIKLAIKQGLDIRQYRDLLIEQYKKK